VHVAVNFLPKPIAQGSDVVAVVIDVLRATSAMATAIASGADGIVACLDIETARSIANETQPRPLLCGERHCHPIDGFDLGNSPRDYTPARVAGQTLVMTTTNGTVAMAAAAGAKTVYAACFNNLSAIVESLRDERTIVIMCAGTDGAETSEDILCAGAIVQRLLDQTAEVTLDANATTAAATWRSFTDQSQPLADHLAASEGGLNLCDRGYRRDVDDCAVIDAYDAVPTMVSRNPIRLCDPRRRATPENGKFFGTVA